MAYQFTDKGVEAAIRQAVAEQKSRWLHESRGWGMGALSLKVAPSGTANWYYRYSIDRRHKYFPLGRFGRGRDDLTLRAARDRCSEAAQDRAKVGDGDLHAERKEQRQATRKARAQRQAVEIERSKQSLTALMRAYSDSLRAKGKTRSAADTECLIRLHLFEAFPEYAAAPAADLTRRQAAEIFRRLADEKKMRTAQKVRSFMRAAYAMALQAEGDPLAPAAMLAFDLEANPIADTSSLAGAVRPGQRHLSEAELRAYWARLGSRQGFAADAARVAMLTGGQRMAQLLRADLDSFDEDAGTLTLLDGKGRRAQPRRHVIALPAQVVPILELCADRASAKGYSKLFGPTVPDTVSGLVSEISAEMIKEKEVRTQFAFKDLRRTVETLMAERLRVSKDLRALIQSHGLGGVQDRHYDRADYGPQIRHALNEWCEWLKTGQLPLRLQEVELFSVKDLPMSQVVQ